MQPNPVKPRRKISAGRSVRRLGMRDWMAFATAIVLALLTKMLLP